MRGYYRILLGNGDQSFPWKSIWKSKTPSRVAFFSWTAALGKILTIHNLWKKKMLLLDWCYNCECNGESVNHLLLYCPVATELWAMVLGLFGVYWVVLKTFVDLLASWPGCFRRYWNGLLWMAAPHCLMWCI